MLRVPKTVFTVVSPLQTLVGDRLGCTPAFDGAKFLIETLSLGLGWRVPLRPPPQQLSQLGQQKMCSFIHGWNEGAENGGM